jgi:hypothetical protein
MMFRVVLEDADETAHHPGVAPAPEGFRAVGFTFGEIGAVAVIEVLGGVVETAGRAPAVRDRKVEVTVVARRGPEANSLGRRHEERIAPRSKLADAPLLECDGREVARAGEDGVEALAQRRDPLRVFGALPQFDLGWADGVIVGVIFARAGLALVGVAYADHRFTETRTGGRVIEGHHVGEKCALRPVGERVLAGIRELPVGAALHHREGFGVPLGRGDAGLGGAGGQTAEHKQGTKQEAHGRIFCMSQRRLDAKSGLAGS